MVIFSLHLQTYIPSGNRFRVEDGSRRQHCHTAPWCLLALLFLTNERSTHYTPSIRLERRSFYPRNRITVESSTRCLPTGVSLTYLPETDPSMTMGSDGEGLHKTSPVRVKTEAASVVTSSSVDTEVGPVATRTEMNRGPRPQNLDCFPSVHPCNFVFVTRHANKRPTGKVGKVSG